MTSTTSTTNSSSIIRLALATTLACTLALGTAVQPADAAQTPEQAIQQTADEILATLNAKDTTSQAKQAEIERILTARGDIGTITKLVLARGYRDFSEEQRTRFIESFRTYLSVTYGRNVDSYANETVEILGGRDEARGDYTVQSKILRGSAEDILVDYRMRKFGEEWKIIDVIAEGVSMVGNLRSQFQEVLSRDGAEGLIKALEKKNTTGGDSTDTANAGSTS